MCCGGIEQAFDTFYTMALGMLDAFYPVKSITVSNRDPVFVTPEIKSLLRKINKLRRSGKIEAANSLSEKMSKIIIRRNSDTFSKTPRGSRELWERVNKITGKSKISQGVSQSSINADSLNAHYASMSTDIGYETPVTKRPEPRYFQTFNEYEVFNQLDTLGATACGLDGLPHWFLRIAAPCFSTPIAFLFNLSLTWSMVPRQWKASRITPVPKVPRPIACSDFRPISITPILSRIMEKTIVRQFFYPILHSPLCYSSFPDQFAFRPTGSTTCALIKLTYELTTMLQEYPYVHVISLDFSKAFDTVRHSSLVQKLSQFPIPIPVHNWFVNYLSGRSHCTKFQSTISGLLTINASIFQGTSMGPVSYVFNSSDLVPCCPGNRFNKYADDTYILVPPSNYNTINIELENISQWAIANNLKLNSAKSTEMIVSRPRVGRDHLAFPAPTSGIQRVDMMKILGVTLTYTLSFNTHIDIVLRQAAQSLYALRVLRSHGLTGEALWDVTRATTLSKMLYASPAWWGYVDMGYRQRLQNFIFKLQRLGFLPNNTPSFEEMCGSADDVLFGSMLTNEYHVLAQLLPPVKETPYHLRPRAHNRSLPATDNIMRKNFVMRMLYKDSF